MDKFNTTDAAEQNASSRAGAQARGGIAPQPGDPTDPKSAAEHAKERNQRLADDGFGDHQGARLDRPGH